jgi:hypothetical protein
MTSSRLRLGIIIGAPILILVWFLWWSSSSVQANRTFARLKSAIENGQAVGVLDNLHSAYDIKGSWPNQIGNEAGDMVGNGALRVLVLRGLAGLFQLQSQDPFLFGYTISNVDPQDDGTVAVTVSITLRTQSGHEPLTFTPSLTNQRFILAKDGWWPALYVKSHPALSVSY